MALIPPYYIDCVVALGVPQQGQTTKWIASGFFVGDLVPGEPNAYHVGLVTNRHVLEGVKTFIIRCNPVDATPAKEFPLTAMEEDGTRRWFGPPDVDVAVMPVEVTALAALGIKTAVFTSDRDIVTMGQAKDLGITEGDGIYALGFPLGQVGQDRNYVIVRQGCIARIRDALAGQAKEFLADLSLFPGSSGGPLVTRPELTAIQGTKSQHASYVIGMVQGYLPYRDVAVSTQTGRTRVVFEENSGLAAVIPMDYVLAALREHVKVIGVKE